MEVLVKNKPKLILAFMMMLILAGCSNMGGMDAEYAEIPVGMAYTEGKEIYFMHTEASDADIAELLTDMMDSPVIHVPSLAAVPESSLASVYVFENGLEGMGPLGFQPDVFDAPPGSAGYSPLRVLILVRWQAGIDARELRSVEEILAALNAGELQLSRTGIVINMPFVTWDGGMR